MELTAGRWLVEPNWCGIMEVAPTDDQFLGEWSKLKNESLMEAEKGERQVGGSRAPGERKTFVVFFLFFHLARRFWNQTYK